MHTDGITSQAAALLGRMGGKSTSDAKRAAAAENGKLGGRPYRRNKKELSSMSDEEIMAQFRRYTNGDTFTEIGIVESKRVDRTEDNFEGIGRCIEYRVVLTCSGKDYLDKSWLVTERQPESDCKIFATRRSSSIPIGERVVLDSTGRATILDASISWLS